MLNGDKIIDDSRSEHYVSRARLKLQTVLRRRLGQVKATATTRAPLLVVGEGKTTRLCGLLCIEDSSRVLLTHLSHCHPWVDQTPKRGRKGDVAQTTTYRGFAISRLYYWVPLNYHIQPL